MYLDVNDDEAWQSWTSEAVSSLDLVVAQGLARLLSVDDSP